MSNINNFFLKFIIISIFIIISFSIGIYSKAHILASSQLFTHTIEAISIAIKEIKTSSEGYIGYNSLHNVLNKSQAYNHIFGITWGQNINDNIDKVLDLIEKKNFDNEDKHILFNSEIGYVDYIKIAFALFGFKIQSLFFLYYLIFSISSLVCLVYVHKNREKFQIFTFFILGIISVQLSIFLPVNDFLPFNYEYNNLPFYKIVSVNNARFISTLCIIPSLYLTLYLIEYEKQRLLSLIGFFLNLLIVLFLFRIRFSVIWCFIPVLIFSAGFLVNKLFFNRVELRKIFLKIILIIFIPIMIISVNVYDFSKKNILYDIHPSLVNHAPAFMFINGIFINDEIRKKYLGYERKEVINFDKKCKINNILTFDRILFCKLNNYQFSKKIIETIFYKFNIYKSFSSYDDDVTSSGLVFLKKNNIDINNLFLIKLDKLDFSELLSSKDKIILTPLFMDYDFQEQQKTKDNSLIEFEWKRHFNYKYLQEISPLIIKDIFLNNFILVFKIFVIDKPILFLVIFLLYFVVFNNFILLICTILFLNALYFAKYYNKKISIKYKLLILVFFLSSISQNIMTISHSQVISDGSVFLFIYFILFLISIFKKFLIRDS